MEGPSKHWKRKILDENFLMSIASLGAMYLGEYHEAIESCFSIK